MRDEVEVKIKFVPKMERTKWSKHMPTRQEQFWTNTLAIAVPWADSLDKELKQLYYKAE